MPQVGFEFLRSFETSQDTLVLRRYMADWKFVALIESSSLYFAPASGFPDKLEGHYTDLDNELSDRQLAQWGLDSRSRDIAADAWARIATQNQKAVVICCWTAGDEEDPRMWSDYGESPDAVAIETSVGNLRRALGLGFLIVPVTYLNFSRQGIPKDHSLQPFFFKHYCFGWEREVRVLGEVEDGKRLESPRLVPLNLATVFHKIIVSPRASASYRLAVESRLSAASLAIPVSDSALR